MKHVKLFEEFLNLNNRSEEAGLNSRFATSDPVADIMRNKTHSVSRLISDENGIRTEIVSNTDDIIEDVVKAAVIAITTEEC